MTPRPVDWTDPRYDRRDPPQVSLRDLIERVNRRLDDAEAREKELIRELATASEQRQAVRDEVAELRAEIKPLTEAFQVLRAVKWLTAGMIVAIVSLASSWVWLKTHVLGVVNGVKP